MLFTNEKNYKQNTIHFLQKTKENYSLSSKQIAREIGATEASISRWLNGQTKPSNQKIEDIWSFFSRTWIKGIICLPQNSQWGINFFVQVADVKNPFETFYLDKLFENGPKKFIEMVAECEEITNGRPTIYRTFTTESEYLIEDVTRKLNVTMAFHDCFTQFNNLEDCFAHFKGLNPGAFDYQLIKELKNGAAQA